MARPSKLTDAQRSAIKEETINGASSRALAIKYKVSKATILSIVTDHVKDMKSVANTISSELSRFDISDRAIINRFAEDLLATSNNMAKAAKHMSNVTAKFSEIADAQMDRIDSLGSLEENMLHMKSIDAMTSSAGKAAYIPLSLINSNKDLAPKAPEKEPEDVSITSDPVEASKQYQRMIKGE